MNSPANSSAQQSRNSILPSLSRRGGKKGEEKSLRYLSFLLGLYFLCPILDEPAYAHTIVEFYNPYYLMGAAAAVIVSFVIFSLFWKRPSLAVKYPRHNLLHYKYLGSVLSSGNHLLPWLRVFSVLLFLLIIIAGLIGSQEEKWNITPLLIWFGGWFVIPLFQVLVGNVWFFLNPLKIGFEWIEKMVFPGSDATTPIFSYPQKLEAWPAFFFFLCFAWFGSVHPQAQNPRLLSQLVIAYSLITWGGMYLFRRKAWLAGGEFVSVVFGLFSRLSPTETRVSDEEICRSCSGDCRNEMGECLDCYECYSRSLRKELNLRPYGVGLLQSRPIRVSEMMMILLLLSEGMFKGLIETYAWKMFWFKLGVQMDFSEYVLGYNSLGFFSFFFLVSGIYLGFSCLIRIFSNSLSKTRIVALFFAPSLLPVAAVFHFAHKLDDFVENIQQFYKILSDPFGFGWNLFGTRLHSVIHPNLFWVWHGQLAIIITAHIFAVYYSHILALRFCGDSRVAIKSQIPMLALMVLYTVSGLWIISTIPQIV